MPPHHPFTPAEQQRVSSIQAAMAAGQDTSRYSAQLVAATLAAMAGRGTTPPPSGTSPE